MSKGYFEKQLFEFKLFMNSLDVWSPSLLIFLCHSEMCNGIHHKHGLTQELGVHHKHGLTQELGIHHKYGLKQELGVHQKNILKQELAVHQKNGLTAELEEIKKYIGIVQKDIVYTMIYLKICWLGVEQQSPILYVLMKRKLKLMFTNSASINKMNNHQYYLNWIDGSDSW